MRQALDAVDLPKSYMKLPLLFFIDATPGFLTVSP